MYSHVPAAPCRRHVGARPLRRNRPSITRPRSSISSTDAAAAGGTISVREATPADVPRLAAIEALCAEFSAHWDAAAIQEELGRAMSRVLVAADPGSNEALGYIVAWLIAGELQVLELAVDPAHQGRGIGGALLSSLMADCSFDEAVLEVKAHNSRAVRLYERAGFKRVGLRRGYYADGSDALLMSRPAGV